MSWQDLVFLSGSLLTVLALLPTLRDANARIPIATSVPKLTLGLVYTGTFYSLGMTLSALGLLATGVAWALVASLRSPTGRSLSIRSETPGIDRSPVAETTRSVGRDGDQF